MKQDFVPIVCFSAEMDKSDSESKFQGLNSGSQENWKLFEKDSVDPKADSERYGNGKLKLLPSQNISELINQENDTTKHR